MHGNHSIARVALFLFLIPVIPAFSIVVQDNAAALDPPAGLDWSHVYNYNGSSAVAVGGNWLITAGHVADDGSAPLNIDGTIYTPQEVRYHQDADLALVRFDRPFPGYYPLHADTNLFTDPKLEVLLVGFGSTGTVSVAGFWTIDGNNGRGTKRWGSQKIDTPQTRAYNAGGTVGSTVSIGFQMEFDLANTTHEAGIGYGDSGGGVFYNDGGIWKLVGINTAQSGSGGAYIKAFAVSMPSYHDWIADTIPEPQTIALMSLSTLGLLVGRSMRRRKLAGSSVFPIVREYACDSFVDTEELEDVCRKKAKNDEDLNPQCW